MENSKKCIVCSMPLVEKEDYPEGDTSKDYCRHCGTKEGLHPYEQLVDGMSEFIQDSQGMAKEQADKAAGKVIADSVAAKSGRIEKD